MSYKLVIIFSILVKRSRRIFIVCRKLAKVPGVFHRVIMNVIQLLPLRVFLRSALVAGVVTCNQCVGMLSLNSELETCNHLFHSRKIKPKNIYSLPETGKGFRGILPGYYECNSAFQ